MLSNFTKCLYRLQMSIQKPGGGGQKQTEGSEVQGQSQIKFESRCLGKFQATSRTGKMVQWLKPLAALIENWGFKSQHLRGGSQPSQSLTAGQGYPMPYFCKYQAHTQMQAKYSCIKNKQIFFLNVHEKSFKR